MDTALTIKLPVDRKAPSLARRALEGLDGELEGVREPVKLLVSEAVTNSVKHAGLEHGQKIELEVWAGRSKVRVNVTDYGRGFNPEARAERGPRGGFGLFLVDELADRWGFEPGESRLWFEIDRPSGG